MLPETDKSLLVTSLPVPTTGIRSGFKRSFRRNKSRGARSMGSQNLRFININGRKTLCLSSQDSITHK
jgi:hypothetical protein